MVPAPSKAETGMSSDDILPPRCYGGSRREYVALKVQKSADHYMDAAYDEIELLKMVQKQVCDSHAICTERERCSQMDRKGAIHLASQLVSRCDDIRIYASLFQSLTVNTDDDGPAKGNARAKKKRRGRKEGRRAAATRRGLSLLLSNR